MPFTPRVHSPSAHVTPPVGSAARASADARDSRKTMVGSLLLEVYFPLIGVVLSNALYLAPAPAVAQAAWRACSSPEAS